MASVGLPAISSKLAPDVRQFLQRVREFVSGADFVSPGDLTRAGIASLDAYGNLAAGSAEETDRSIPPAPVNVTANGALTTIVLEWDDPHYKNLSYAEIYRATKAKPEDPDPTIGDAVHVGITSGCIFAAPVPQDSSFWFWVRFWSRAGVAGPWHGTSGIHGATAKDPAYMLATLNGAITTDQLYVDLNKRIDLIDTAGPPEMANGLIAKMHAQQSELSTLDRVANATAESLLSAAVKIQANTDLLYRAGVVVTPGTGEVFIYGVREAENRLDSAEVRLNAAEASIAMKVGANYVDEAIATAVINPSQVAELGPLTQRVTNAELALNGQAADIANKASSLLVGEQGVRLTTAETDIDGLKGEVATKVEATTFAGLEGRVSTAETTLATADFPGIHQSVQDVRYLAKQQDKAAESLLRQVIGANAAAVVAQTGVALARQDITAHVKEGLEAEAQARLDLSTTVGGHTATIQSHTTSINGISASFTMRIDNNGVMSGYGLSSELIAGGAAVSKLINMVDVYAVVAPGRSFGALNSVPFAVLTTAQTINGVAFDPGVYIDGASINHETVGSAQIGKEVVDDSHVANISAAKVKFGEMSGDRIGVNSLNSDRLITNTLAAKLAQITTAYVGNEHITGFIQSVDYVAGSAGWKIDKGGAVEFNTGVFRGSLAAASGTFTGEVKGGMFNVGAYTGYAWPAAGNYGAHLSASGLRVGNANNGKYFEATAAGNVYAPGIKIENGALTIFNPTTGKVIMTSGSVSIAEAAATASWGSISGAGKPADYADVTRYNTAAAIAGQGALATVNALTRANISSYMEALAVGTAFIDNLSVNGNKITGVVSGSVYLGAGASVWIPTVAGRVPLVGMLSATVDSNYWQPVGIGRIVSAVGGFTLINESYQMIIDSSGDGAGVLYKGQLPATFVYSYL